MSKKIFKPFCFFVSLMLLLMATFTIKQAAEIAQMELSEIKKQIEFEKQSISVLTAERSFLRQPERISKLAASHLGVCLSDVSQIASYNNNDLPKSKRIAKSKDVRWRYKKPTGNYVTLTAKKN